MTTAITHYLNSVRENLRLDLSAEKQVISELETHIEDELQELREAGLSEEEAVSTCVRLLGSARIVARQIYEAHNQGTWRQALLAAMPHLLFGLMFALNWWWGLGWLTLQGWGVILFLLHPGLLDDPQFLNGKVRKIQSIGPPGLLDLFVLNLHL